MRRKYLALTAFGVALALGGCRPGSTGGGASGPDSPIMDRARVTDASGSAYEKLPASSSWQNVNVGDILAPATTIKTAANGAVLLLLTNGHVFRIGGATVVSLNQLGQGKSFGFSMMSGEIWSLVQHAVRPTHYEVDTPSAVVGVSGTLFTVAYNPKTADTLVSTDDGVVTVRHGKMVTRVPKGFQTRVHRYQARPLVAVPFSPLERHKWQSLHQNEGWLTRTGAVLRLRVHPPETGGGLAHAPVSIMPPAGRPLAPLPPSGLNMMTARKPRNSPIHPGLAVRPRMSQHQLPQHQLPQQRPAQSRLAQRQAAMRQGLPRRPALVQHQMPVRARRAAPRTGLIQHQAPVRRPASAQHPGFPQRLQSVHQPARASHSELTQHLGSRPSTVPARGPEPGQQRAFSGNQHSDSSLEASRVSARPEARGDQEPVRNSFASPPRAERATPMGSGGAGDAVQARRAARRAARLDRAGGDRSGFTSPGADRPRAAFNRPGLEMARPDARRRRAALMSYISPIRPRQRAIDLKYFVQRSHSRVYSDIAHSRGDDAGIQGDLGSGRGGKSGFGMGFLGSFHGTGTAGFGGPGGAHAFNGLGGGHGRAG